jgi:predicted RNA-binding protein Jag
MKSIMEEASSVVKAIEKGWIRAGKPNEFTVKVFEEAQKNFIGLTTKSAKIGIFFEDHAITPTLKQAKSQPQQPRKPQQQKQAQPQAKQEQFRSELRPQQQKKEVGQLWSQDVINAAESWIKESLALMGMGHIKFTTEVERFALRVSFQSPITENSEKEKMLFRSWAYLIMQALRHKFKRPFKGLKIILMSNA